MEAAYEPEVKGYSISHGMKKAIAHSLDSLDGEVFFPHFLIS